MVLYLYIYNCTFIQTRWNIDIIEYRFIVELYNYFFYKYNNNNIYQTMKETIKVDKEMILNDLIKWRISLSIL